MAQRGEPKPLTERGHKEGNPNHAPRAGKGTAGAAAIPVMKSAMKPGARSEPKREFER